MLGKGVGAIRCLAQLLASMLFILLGTGFAVAKSQPLHDLSFSPAQINIAAPHATTGFDTRAPLSTVQYVASRGGFTVMQGSEFVVHGQEAVAVSFGLGADLNATNNADGVVDVYRAFGDDARAQGFSWTTVDPRTVDNFRDAAGLPSGGASGANNSADFLL